MRFEQLEYFVEVARQKSITRAAAHLFISQPSLSESMNNLERELGCTLFQRTKHGICLTGQGEVFLEEVQAILERIKGWKRFSAEEKTLCGKINVAYTPSTSVFLYSLASRLAEECPQLRVFFYECLARELFKEFQTGRYSLGLSGIIPAREEEYVTLSRRNNWRLEYLYEDFFHVMISAESPLAEQESLSKADLRHLTLAAMPSHYETVATPSFSKYFGQEYPCYIQDRASIMRLVADGRAAAVFPRISMRDAPEIRTGRVKALPLRDMPMRIKFYLVYPAMDELPPIESKVVEVIRGLNFQE